MATRRRQTPSSESGVTLHVFTSPPPPPILVFPLSIQPQQTRASRPRHRSTLYRRLHSLPRRPDLLVPPAATIPLPIPFTFTSPSTLNRNYPLKPSPPTTSSCSSRYFLLHFHFLGTLLPHPYPPFPTPYPCYISNIQSILMRFESPFGADDLCMAQGVYRGGQAYEAWAEGFILGLSTKPTRNGCEEKKWWSEAGWIQATTYAWSSATQFEQQLTAPRERGSLYFISALSSTSSTVVPRRWWYRGASGSGDGDGEAGMVLDARAKPLTTRDHPHPPAHRPPYDDENDTKPLELSSASHSNITANLKPMGLRWTGMSLLRRGRRRRTYSEGVTEWWIQSWQDALETEKAEKWKDNDPAPIHSSLPPSSSGIKSSAIASHLLVSPSRSCPRPRSHSLAHPHAPPPTRQSVSRGGTDVDADKDTSTPN
ncbi:hypothetical protein R3P38DRAFT_3183404 [Favolaschia claudopus]|uniref:Uncharacterized protein n=1 Tax=Favolaschia claudopus TaxID=2862362 RepID=A0AAW0CB32_9AGAR